MTNAPTSGEGCARLIRWGAASDIGKVRAENQDAFAVEPETGLFLVVDGMGGHRGGAVAAEIVARDLPAMIEIALEKLRSPRSRSIRPLLRRLIREQNRDVHEEGADVSEHAGMGATLALILLRDGRVYAANAGDSKIYRLRDGRLRLLSVEHSIVAELLESGLIAPEQAEHHSMVGVVTQYMGMPEGVEPHVRSLALKPGDRFLLCTDGLTDMVEDKGIAERLKTHAEPQAACEMLVAAANNAGGHDNVTTVVVDWLGES